MTRDKLTAVAVALVSLLVFVFLGAVTFESATSLSTVNQQGILRSLMDPLDTSGEVASIADRLRSRDFLDSETFFAISISQQGPARFIGAESPTADQRAIAHYIRNNGQLEEHQMFFETDRTSFVWVRAGTSANGEVLALVYQRPQKTLITQLKLYFVPSMIAIVVVLWISVWSGLIARRAIRAHQIQKELEMEVVRQEEASRIKSAFLANMNHELRTPLNAIIGFSQMMQMQLLGPIGNTKYVDYVGNILSASNHLRKLIGNILDISKIEAGEEQLEEEVVCVEDVVRECLSMTQAEFDAKNQIVKQDLDLEIPCLLADRLKIRQIILNLLTNANKFTPEGGTITVAVGRLADGRMRIAVEDTGKGIPAAELAAVLQPFKRAQDSAETAKDGFGLGLPLTAALAELHGASFDLKSEVGKGTAVHIDFPTARMVLEKTAPLEAVGL